MKKSKAPAQSPADPLYGAMMGQPSNSAYVPVVPPGHYENLHQIAGEPYATQPMASQTVPQTRKRT